MGNLCSIFHSRYKHLRKVIPLARKAQLMDYILLGWQTSTYKLRNSDKKWFMKPYAEISADTGIPKSTLERYIKELNEEGFIERRQAMFCRNNELGGFESKKGCYIHITDKLIKSITSTEPTQKTASVSPKTDIHNHTDNDHQQKPFKANTETSEYSDLEKNEGTDPLKMRGLYIRDLYTLSLNNVISKKITGTVDKVTLERLTHQFNCIQKLLFTEVKEEIPDEVKKLVSGTFFNLTFKHKKHISSPEQVSAEYLFALLNIDFYMPEIRCFKHRNNILSKLVRENRWRTPKGFYKNFYLGESFKDRNELHEKQWEMKKEAEINFRSSDWDFNAKDERQELIEVQMFEKSTLIDELTKSIHQQSSEEGKACIREKIKALKKELESLWEQQSIIEEEIANNKNEHEQSLCG